jgi:anti-anti-sigma factor
VPHSTRIVQVTPRIERTVPVCEIQGEIDASNVDVVFDRALACASPDAPGLVLDLTSTSYLDSAGIRILFELARRLRSHRQELRVAVADPSTVRRVLVLTALADVVALHPNALDAVAAFAPVE